jgi:hypothetical protein
MGVSYEPRSVSELVPQMAGDNSCQKLSSLKTSFNLKPFLNHCQVQPPTHVGLSWDLGETAAFELYIADNYVALHFQTELRK